MWLNTNLTTRGSNCNRFLFSLYQGYPPKNSFLTVSIDNEFFFLFKLACKIKAHSVWTRHLVHGQILTSHIM